MNLQVESVIALLLATLIGFLPNLIIKLLDKNKERGDLNKVTLESADISLDLLQDALKFAKEQITDLSTQIKELKAEVCLLKDILETYQEKEKNYKKLLEDNNIDYKEN